VAHYQKPATSLRPKTTVPQTSDEFDSPALGLQWQWHANHESEWFSLAARPGWLRLFPQTAAAANLAGLPSLLLQKFPARSFTVETCLDFSALQTGEEAGLVVMGRKHAALAVRRNEDSFQIILRVNNRDHFQQKISIAEITLRLRAGDSGVCEFSFQTNGGFVSVPENFPACAGEWIGAKTGIYCLQSSGQKASGYAGFDYFRFSAFE